MRYTKVVIKGYKRFLPNNIHSITLTPTSPIQLILGSNGSGKSSLIRELSPLPAIASDYEAGGYKEIHIEDGNDTYVLKSSFEGNKHSHTFELNGVNLNDSRRTTMQTELAKQKFNYTPELHDLLIGNTKFTSMSSPVRRHWLTMLSNTDYDYAIRTYNKLAERHRDTVGTIKTLKRRLVTEMEKIISDQEVLALEMEIEGIHKDLGHLLEHRRPLDYQIGQLELQGAQLDENLQRLGKQVIHISTRLKNFLVEVKDKPTADQSLEELFKGCDISISSLNVSIQDVYSDHAYVVSQIEAIRKTQHQTMDDHIKRVDTLLAEQAKLQANKSPWFRDIHPDPQAAMVALAAVEEQLLSCTNELPINDKTYYTRDSRIKFTERVGQLEHTLGNLNTNLQRLTISKQHMTAHKDSPEVHCPQCKHHWILGYSEDKLNAINFDLEQCSAMILDTSSQLEKARLDIAEVKDYFELYKRIQDIMGMVPQAKTLWDYVKDQTILLTAPSKMGYLIKEYYTSLLVDADYHNLFKEIEKAKELIRLAGTVENVSLSTLEHRQTHLESRMQELSTQLSEERQKLKQYKTIDKHINECNKLTDTIRQLLSSREQNYTDQVETHRRSLMNEAIRVVQSNLARKETAIHEARGQRAIIKDIENQLSELQIDEEALKLVVRELSPKEGLIAEGLFGFIDVFLQKFNELMSTVFSYDFKVLPFQLGDDGGVELDYQFPIAIKDNPDPIKDISLASKGQKEIIDLAFVVIASTIKLQSAPLILDEFGANLDSVHRAKAIDMVKLLMETDSFTQLFMVNHYDTVYGAFTNAQTTVLCDANVVIPHGCEYNKNVVIT